MFKLTRSHNEFVDIVRAINPSIEIIGIYTKAHERIAVRCKDCGYEWNPQACHLHTNEV